MKAKKFLQQQEPHWFWDKIQNICGMEKQQNGYSKRSQI